MNKYCLELSLFSLPFVLSYNGNGFFDISIFGLFQKLYGSLQMWFNWIAPLNYKFKCIYCIVSHCCFKLLFLWVLVLIPVNVKKHVKAWMWVSCLRVCWSFLLKMLAFSLKMIGVSEHCTVRPSIQWANLHVRRVYGLTAEYPAIFKLYPQQGWILGHEAYNQGGYADTRIRS